MTVRQEKAVKRLSVITKSFKPDFELCSDLHQSVLNSFPNWVHHDIIVPHSDVKLFGRLAGPRAHIRCETDLLPRSFVPIPFTDITVNLDRLFPPVRGWVLQQVVKLAAVAASEADVVLLVDSDVEFVRPVTIETFVRDGVVRFYRKPHDIDEKLPRHIAWHRTARALLGLPAVEPPYNDYISSPLACDPAIVRQMLARVTATTGRPWTTAIAAQLHFSEWTLYGVFVDDVIGAPANSFASNDPLCLVYWDNTPLSRDGAVDFLRSLRPTDIAAVIQSKSRTPRPVRRAAFDSYGEARIASHCSQAPAEDSTPCSPS
jgi:hypothetical protein